MGVRNGDEKKLKQETEKKKRKKGKLRFRNLADLKPFATLISFHCARASICKHQNE